MSQPKLPDLLISYYKTRCELLAAFSRARETAAELRDATTTFRDKRKSFDRIVEQLGTALHADTAGITGSAVKASTEFDALSYKAQAELDEINKLIYAEEQETEAAVTDAAQ